MNKKYEKRRYEKRRYVKKKKISLITTYRLYEKSHQLEWFDDLDWKVEWWPDLSPGSSPWWSVVLSDHAEDHGGWPHRPKSAPPEWLPADQYWGSVTKKKKPIHCQCSSPNCCFFARIKLLKLCKMAYHHTDSKIYDWSCLTYLKVSFTDLIQIATLFMLTT